MRGRILAVLAVIAYNSWLAWVLNGHPQALSGYLSELAAQDQPYQWLFRLADILAAGLFAVIALLGRRGWEPWLGRRAPQAAAALLLVGVGTALDAVFNLPCAESRDAVCAAAPSTARSLHEAASVLVSVASVAVIALTALGMRERQGCWSRSALLAAALAVLVGALLVASAVLPALAPGTQGGVQAVQVVLLSGWIGLMAWRLQAVGRA